MEVIETVKTWEEASPELQEKILERYRYINVEYDDWYQPVYEHVIEKGYELGFLIDKINFSGFYSQGDGASWAGQIDMVRFIDTFCKDSIGYTAWKELIYNGFYNKHVGVGNNGRGSNLYCHEETMEQTTEFYYDQEWEEGELLLGDSILSGMLVGDVIDLIYHDQECTEKNGNQMVELAIEEAKDYAQIIFKALRKEHECLLSDEAVIETLLANDYTFNEEGVIA